MNAERDKNRLSRRDFLKIAGLSGLMLAGEDFSSSAITAIWKIKDIYTADRTIERKVAIPPIGTIQAI